MGLVTEPVFDTDDYELPIVEWKWLTDAIERLDALCIELEVTRLSEFQCYSRYYAINNLGEEYVLEMEEDMGAEERDDGYYLPNGQILWPKKDCWFSCDDGLKTTQALVSYLEDNSDFWNESDDQNGFMRGIPYILQILKDVLGKGKQQGRRFHFQSLC